MVRHLINTNKLFLAILFFMVTAFQLTGAEIGYVDSRICMLSHPAFQKFDWETRRFFDTISAPAKNFVEEYERLKKQGIEAKAALKKVEKDIGKAFAGTDDKNAVLWQKRRQIVDQLAYIDQRRTVLAELQEKGSNVPEAATTWCTLQGVEADMANVFNRIKQDNNLACLLDMSALTPTQHPPEPQMHVLNRVKLESFLENADSINSEEFMSWLGNSRHYWQRKLPGVFNNPFKYGATDHTDTACAMLKSSFAIKTAEQSEEKSED
ncbi:MAG: hypothetical protein GQF41_3311 [Candidatus Rifleibacterium amylolyticum]|nr:MAG: hypothetical protein GQF41_3311 [Candidatus Rifleibacterium amylolyticum]